MHADVPGLNDAELGPGLRLQVDVEVSILFVLPSFVHDSVDHSAGCEQTD